MGRLPNGGSLHRGHRVPPPRPNLGTEDYVGTGATELEERFGDFVGALSEPHCSTPRRGRPIPVHAPSFRLNCGAGLERLGSDPGVPGIAPSHAGRPGPGHCREQRFDRPHGSPPAALLVGRGRHQRDESGRGRGLQPGGGPGPPRSDRVPAQRHPADRALARHAAGPLRRGRRRCRGPTFEFLLGAPGRRRCVLPRGRQPCLAPVRTGMGAQPPRRRLEGRAPQPVLPGGPPFRPP
jgi:hypothetical protein